MIFAAAVLPHKSNLRGELSQPDGREVFRTGWARWPWRCEPAFGPRDPFNPREDLRRCKSPVMASPRDLCDLNVRIHFSSHELEGSQRIRPRKTAIHEKYAI